MIVTCIRSIRGGIGIAGVILLILLLAGPLIKSVCIILIFRVTSLVLEPAGSDSMSDCMGDLASAASVLTALLFLSRRYVHYFFHLCSALRTFSVEGDPPDFRCRAHSDVYGHRQNRERGGTNRWNMSENGYFPSSFSS